MISIHTERVFEIYSRESGIAEMTTSNDISIWYLYCLATSTAVWNCEMLMNGASDLLYGIELLLNFHLVAISDQDWPI